MQLSSWREHEAVRAIKVKLCGQRASFNEKVYDVTSLRRGLQPLLKLRLDKTAWQTSDEIAGGTDVTTGKVKLR
jgi:hypothetical protein